MDRQTRFLARGPSMSLAVTSNCFTSWVMILSSITDRCRGRMTTFGEVILNGIREAKEVLHIPVPVSRSAIALWRVFPNPSGGQCRPLWKTIFNVRAVPAGRTGAFRRSAALTFSCLVRLQFGSKYGSLDLQSRSPMGRMTLCRELRSSRLARSSV